MCSGLHSVYPVYHCHYRSSQSVSVCCVCARFWLIGACFSSDRRQMHANFLFPFSSLLSVLSLMCTSNRALFSMVVQKQATSMLLCGPISVSFHCVGSAFCGIGSLSHTNAFAPVLLALRTFSCVWVPLIGVLVSPTKLYGQWAGESG